MLIRGGVAAPVDFEVSRLPAPVPRRGRAVVCSRTGGRSTQGAATCLPRTAPGPPARMPVRRSRWLETLGETAYAAAGPVGPGAWESFPGRVGSRLELLSVNELSAHLYTSRRLSSRNAPWTNKSSFRNNSIFCNYRKQKHFFKSVKVWQCLWTPLNHRGFSQFQTRNSQSFPQ